MPSTASPQSPQKPRPDDIAAQAVIEGQVKVTTVAGLDTAANRIHLYCNNGWHFHYVCPKNTDPDDRRHQLHDHARRAFELLPAGTLLVVEEPLALQKNGKTTRLLGLAAGAIWAAHLDCRIFWAWADIAAWKKAVIGNGNANKEKIVDWVKENMGLDFDELGKDGEDLYDAAAICRYGEQAVGLK